MMKVLIVASYNKGYYAPFIVEQGEALKKHGCDVEYFGIVGKGIAGYLKSFPSLKKSIRDFNPDLIHAHYGLSGLMANLQRRVPVVTTFHGSDINEKKVFPFSKIAMALSRHSIFVSQRTIDIACPRKNYSLIPCGINLCELQLTSKECARDRMGFDKAKKYVLFSGAFDNPVKNYPLAESTMAFLPKVELVELKGYSRSDVTLLMCAADAILMTSLSEGSPQVIKEALACGCPVVSVDVGDVSQLVAGVDACAIVPRSPELIAAALSECVKAGKCVKGRDCIVDSGLDNGSVVDKLMDIYRKCVR